MFLKNKKFINKSGNLTMIKNEQKKKLVEWISKEITSREYTQKEMDTLMLCLEKKDQLGAWKILLKDHECTTFCWCKNDEKSQLIIKELQSNKNKEEKVEKVVDICLNYLNQDVKEDWKKKKNKSLMLLTLAESEWKSAKKEAFKEAISKNIVEKMTF
jgi:hypothetical protein